MKETGMSEDIAQDTVQEVTPISQETEPTQSPELGDAIAESKKYRGRAQKAESKLTKMEKQLEKDRQTQLEQKEEWKTLADERKSKLEKYETELEVVRKEREAEHKKLLSDFSEKDREELKELPLKQLRVVHGKLVQKPNVPNVNNSNPMVNIDPNIGDWTKLSPSDKRKNWPGILASFKK